MLRVLYVYAACFPFCLLPDPLGNSSPALFLFFSFKIFIEHFYIPSPVLDTGDTMVKKSDEASLFKELLYT